MKRAGESIHRPYQWVVIFQDGSRKAFHPDWEVRHGDSGTLEIVDGVGDLVEMYAPGEWRVARREPVP